MFVPEVVEEDFEKISYELEYNKVIAAVEEDFEKISYELKKTLKKFQSAHLMAPMFCWVKWQK